MVIIYCLISFMLGWGLSRWAEKQSVVIDNNMRVDTFESLDSPFVVVKRACQCPQEADEAPIEVKAEDVAIDDNDDNVDVWFFDTQYLDGQQESTQLIDANVQAQKYFLENFHDEAQRLSQRVTALKAVLSMNLNLSQDNELAEYIYHVLLTTDETTYPEETAYLLGMIAGRISSQKLPGLAIYLKAANAQVREEALKAIAPADTQGKYRKYVEFILNNDPQSEVRALAFVMLEQYYPHDTSNAA